MPLRYLPRLIGNSDFEDVLTEVNRDRCRLHLQLLEKMRGWVGAGLRASKFTGSFSVSRARARTRSAFRQTLDTSAATRPLRRS